MLTKYKFANEFASQFFLLTLETRNRYPQEKLDMLTSFEQIHLA